MEPEHNTELPVFETDGPPLAYFEVAEGLKNADGDMYVTRLVYRSIACIGDSEEQVRKWMDDALEQIRAWCRQEGAFIFWRRRPVFFEEGGVQLVYPTEADIEAGAENAPREVPCPKHWKARARLITSTPMPEEVWERFIVKEGEQARHA